MGGLVTKTHQKRKFLSHPPVTRRFMVGTKKQCLETAGHWCERKFLRASLSVKPIGDLVYAAFPPKMYNV